MSHYPKIYSISTVGVRQHENADYRLHSVRTDFTGNNGLGKSLIADLLQLIFVPLRDEWKPGTEGLDEKERKVETIPLEKEWISHAYSFLNIEKAKGKFITIGVFIPRTSRVPVRPFIIQQGDDFESKKIMLKPFEQALKSDDFIAENLQIYDLAELKRSLFTKYKIHLKDFYQKDQVIEYFDLLFKNQILPIDLTKETNLKSFAKVLQSFAKAKTLKITDSKSLQNFLFEDDDDIKTTFDNQKETLDQHIRNFHRADQEIKSLESKQQRLSQLKATYIKNTKAKESYLSKNAHLFSKKYNEGLKAFNDNETRKSKANEGYEIARRDYEKQCNESFELMIEQKEICNEIRIKLEDEQAEAGNQSLEKLKLKLDSLKVFLNKLETLNPLIEKYKTFEIIQTKFANQEKIKAQKRKLTQLKTCGHFGRFENSKWVEGYDKAYNYYNEKTILNQDKIKSLSEVLALYEGSNADSLLSWAIEQKSILTIEQETVIMSLKDIYIKRIEASKGKKFTLNPKSLMNSYEIDGEGIWILLGDVSEYYPFEYPRLFDGKEKLEKAIANNKQGIKKEIRDFEYEIDQIKELNDALIKIGLNQELIDIYLNQQEIEGYEVNRLLTEENLQFISENFESFSTIQSFIIESKKLDEEITEAIRKTTRIELLLKDNSKIQTQLLFEYNDLKSQITSIVRESELNVKSMSKEILISLRDDNEKEIKAAEKVRVQIKKRQDDYFTSFNAAKGITSSLNDAKEKAENHFAKAKENLEEQTDLKFDSLLALGEVTEDIVSTEKNTFEDLQGMYHTEYISVAEVFEESKSDKRNPELYGANGMPYYSYQILENILCGKIGLNGLTKELDHLNKTLITLGDLQMKILTEVFSLVEKQYKSHETTIRSLNFFFEKNKVSDAFKFKVEFDPRKDINIDWIEKMKAKTRVHKHGADLFTLPEDLPSNENTPEKLIKNIAKTFYSTVSAETSQLLNPKFYFTLKVKMEDEKGKSNSGSGGQAYTALALLCIGRLSIVQKHQERNPGVKFIIIEELSNIDDTNFNIFPEIARQYGYQLMTMTPKPFGSYTNEEWYLHMLVKGKEDKERNYTPMSFFKTKYKKVELEKHLQEYNELEST